MKILVLIILFTGLSADMFDEMRKVFVDQVGDVTDTSHLVKTQERDTLLKDKEEREKRKQKQKLRNEKELGAFEVKLENMHDKVDSKELLKEATEAGNTYLDITMNKLSTLAKNTKYLGLDREWTKRTNTNGVGTISLSGVMSEENIMKYNQFIQSKYTFINKKSYKTAELNRATTQSVYSNEGDKIIFSVHTTEYKNPTLYKMVIEYISKEELFFRN